MKEKSSRALITLRDAAFGYNGQPVVRNVSFDIIEGEFIGLIGPNGAGKSTLFKGMLRLLPPMRGSVAYSPDIYRRIGYVPQRDQLDSIYPLTAFDVARMGITGILPWYRFPDREMNARVRACLGQVGMEDLGAHVFSDLSGGQRQRVLIARALAMDPKILVLDEPTAGIDPVAEENILGLLMELNKSKGLTILMVSHHIQSLRNRVQRAILIKDGTVSCGPAEKLLHPDKVSEMLS